METLSAALRSVQDSTTRYPIIVSLAVLVVAHRFWRHHQRRSRILPRNQERVLIIGASSGIGRAIAHEYAAAGAHICIVGRREHELNAVTEECSSLLPKAAVAGSDYESRVVAVAGDFTKADDMLAVREKLEQSWSGLDTLVVCAGVSALRPLLQVAGLQSVGGTFIPAQVDVEGVQRTVAAASAAVQGNYIGPMVCAVTFIPLLSASSNVPSILLLSSLAAVVPAPTRSLYGSTKASSLLLYQSLSIEHPSIAFSYIMPSTVEGDFRASAVDGGTPREADPNKYGLKRSVVAKRCMEAIDNGEKAVFLPAWYGWSGFFGYWLVPRVVEYMAGRKYQYATS